MRQGEKAAMRRTIGQFLKFSLVGCSNVAITLTIYYLFVFVDPSLYLWGNAVGWAAGVLNAFYWSNRVVFSPADRSRAQLIKRLLKSFAGYAVTFSVSQLLLYLQVHHMGISDQIAPLLNLFFTLPANFLFNKLWTFRERVNQP